MCKITDSYSYKFKVDFDLYLLTWSDVHSVLLGRRRNVPKYNGH